MGDILRSKRRILTAGLGVAAFTAVEGLACGNPVEPRGPVPHEMYPPADAASAPAEPTDEPGPTGDAGAAPVPVDPTVAPPDTPDR